MRNVIVGSLNPDKLAALRGLLGPVATVSAPPFPGSPLDAEDGPTIEAIAAEKARSWSRWLRERGSADPVLVTDGGLTVPALGPAWDPTRTRRFAGPGATPLQLARALLDATSHLTGDDRRVGWSEAASIVFPGEEPVTFVAESPPGIVARTIRERDFAIGDGGGFWVPAVWRCPEHGLKRLIDLSPAERAARPDHWDRLGEPLRRYLIRRFADD